MRSRAASGRWARIAPTLAVLGALVLLAGPAVVSAAPEVQGPLGSVGALGASASVQTTAAVPAGGSIILLVSATGNVTSTTPTCLDSVNGPYTVEQTGGSPAQSAVIAVCARHGVGATPAGTTITVTWPGAVSATQNQIIAIAATGLGATPFHRGIGTPSVQSGAALTTGAVSTTTAANALLVGGFYVSSTVAAAGFAAGGNGTSAPCATSGTPFYTALPGVGAASFSLWAESCVVTATGAYAATGTLPGAGTGYVGVLVVYGTDEPAATPATTVISTSTPATAPATATPGSGGGGGEEPQDRLICESLPGGPRELRIKDSEWPAYRDRSSRGACPAGGGPVPAVGSSPFAVAGTAGVLPPGPPLAEGAGPTPLPVPLRLDSGGRARVTLLGARSSECDGDLLVLAPPLVATPVPGDGLPPGARRLWAGALRHLGESVELGPYPAGTELVLGFAPAGFCAGGAARSSTGPAARVVQAAPGVWDIWWEDFVPAGADFDDLVVRVEWVERPIPVATPTPQPAATVTPSPTPTPSPLLLPSATATP